MSFVYDFLKSCGVFWVSTVNSTDCPSDNTGPACSHPASSDNILSACNSPISSDKIDPTHRHSTSSDNIDSVYSRPTSSENANKSFSVLPRFFCPACRPFGAVAEYSGHLYISTGNTKEVYKQFKNLPYIQITALKAETREWLRLDAMVEERTALSEKKMMLENCPVLKNAFPLPTIRFSPCFG